MSNEGTLNSNYNSKKNIGKMYANLHFPVKLIELISLSKIYYIKNV